MSANSPTDSLAGFLLLIWKVSVWTFLAGISNSFSTLLFSFPDLFHASCLFSTSLFVAVFGLFCFSSCDGFVNSLFSQYFVAVRGQCLWTYFSSWSEAQILPELLIQKFAMNFNPLVNFKDFGLVLFRFLFLYIFPVINFHSHMLNSFAFSYSSNTYYILPVPHFPKLPLHCSFITLCQMFLSCCCCSFFPHFLSSPCSKYLFIMFHSQWLVSDYATCADSSYREIFQFSTNLHHSSLYYFFIHKFRLLISTSSLSTFSSIYLPLKSWTNSCQVFKESCHYGLHLCSPVSSQNLPSIT